MIREGERAPDFRLRDQFGREVSLADFAGRQHVLLVFYPLDWTPTWSREIPALEAALPRFRAAHTQVLGVSVDSHHSHANWARDLGGISFPLLSDFEPKGAMAKSFGLYLDGPGITDRATVLIGADGVVRHASSVGPGGERDIGELAALAERLDAAYDGPVEDRAAGPDVAGAVLYLRDACGFSRAVRVALDNLHQSGVEIRNVSRDEAALASLREVSGGETAPCLVLEGEVLRESPVIIARLADLVSRLR